MLLTWLCIAASAQIPDFRLKSAEGKYVALSDYPGARGFIVVFTCNHCPFARLYPERLNKLNEQYSKLGVPVIAISSSDTVQYEEDSYEKMQVRAKAGHYLFPYLYDPTQTVARQFNAQKTPHAFVIWKEENAGFRIRYSGAIDDNGAEPAKVKHHYVEDAVDQLLAGKVVAVPTTRSIGCQISYR